jgi:hypothetical protein
LIRVRPPELAGRRPPAPTRRALSGRSPQGSARNHAHETSAGQPTGGCTALSRRHDMPRSALLVPQSEMTSKTPASQTTLANQEPGKAPRAWDRLSHTGRVHHIRSGQSHGNALVPPQAAGDRLADVLVGRREQENLPHRAASMPAPTRGTAAHCLHVEAVADAAGPHRVRFAREELPA